MLGLRQRQIITEVSKNEIVAVYNINKLPFKSAAELLTDSLLLAFDRDCAVGTGSGMGGVLSLSLSTALRVAIVLL